MPEWHEMSALALGAEIERGAVDPYELACYFADRITDNDDPERPIFTVVTARRMEAEALTARDRQQRGLRRSPLDGVPVSWKDLFDMAGEVTAAGSALLADNIARRDAPAVARLTRAGLVSLGKTTMSEFAFSGLGVNPVCGTPRFYFDPETPRAPGGSTSGGAASLVKGIAAAALGTDTGGSVRIPAAWSGLVGLKTTAGLISTTGVAPLSRTYDSVGPITRDVADAAVLYALLANRPVPDLAGMRVRDVHVIVPSNPPVSACEPPVGEAFERVLERLGRAGCTIRRRPVAALERADRLLSDLGNPVTADAQAEWGDLVRRHPEKVFAPIRRRIAEGEGMSAETYVRLRNGLREAGAQLRTEIAGEGLLLTPAVSIVPPPLGPLLDDPKAHAEANLAALKLTRLANFLNLTAVTFPAGRTKPTPDTPALPFGVMLTGPAHGEPLLLRMTAALAPLFREG